MKLNAVLLKNVPYIRSCCSNQEESSCTAIAELQTEYVLSVLVRLPLRAASVQLECLR